MNADISNISPASINYTLDIFGQNPRLSRLYTQLCFFFESPDSGIDSCHNVVHYLQDGLNRLCLALPWIAGHVVQGSANVYSVKRRSNPLRLIPQDRRDDLQSLDSYRKAGFPFSMIDEAVVAARKTLPEESDDPAAVLLVKATFIHGGIILNFDAQHNCVDMAGQCQLIRLYSKACRGELFTSEETHVGNALSHNILPHRTDDLDYAPSQPTKVQHPAAYDQSIPMPASTTDTAWAYFLFSAPALSRLKSLASESKTAPFISTDDALSALVWQRVTLARTPDMDAATLRAGSTFERQVDARSALGLSAGCPGNFVHKASAHLACETLAQQSLGALASILRQALGSKEEVAAATRASAAKLLQTLREPLGGRDSATAGGAARKAGISAADIRMSSWAKEDCCSLDFGSVLGRPVAVRRPMFPAWEGLAYLMPKTLDGEIAVALCLRREAMERLRRDDVFASFGLYVG